MPRLVLLFVLAGVLSSCALQRVPRAERSSALAAEAMADTAGFVAAREVGRHLLVTGRPDSALVWLERAAQRPGGNGPGTELLIALAAKEAGRSGADTLLLRTGADTTAVANYLTALRADWDAADAESVVPTALRSLLKRRQNAARTSLGLDPPPSGLPSPLPPPPPPPDAP
ncbi:MAG: hypothetical protein AAF752_11010 [Bacteroidota bacterium]